MRVIEGLREGEGVGRKEEDGEGGRVREGQRQGLKRGGLRQICTNI